MSAKSAFYIKDLTPTDLELLTQLLSAPQGQPITVTWLRSQGTLLSTFPPSLLKPNLLFIRALMALPFTPAKACLCSTHNRLNGQLIRRIFLRVSAECTTNLTRLVENPHLTPQLAAHVQRLRAVNSLWMSTELYRAVFRPMPDEKRFEHVESGCEACTVAYIGGDHQILSDLRASMLGRRKRDRPQAILLKLVDAWIDWTGRGIEIREESHALGKEIRECRCQMQKTRRQERRNRVEGCQTEAETERTKLLGQYGNDIYEMGEGDDDENKNEDDFEGSIIDCYSNIMSNASTPPSPCLTQGMHPAFRDSIAFDPVSGTFHPAVPVAQAPRPPTVYTASVYSDSESRSREARARPYDFIPEMDAQGYRSLARSQEDQDPQARKRCESNSAGRVTRWGDFQYSWV